MSFNAGRAGSGGGWNTGMKSRSPAGRDFDDEIGRRRDVGRETQELRPLLEDAVLLLRLTRLSRGGERGERDKPCRGESPRPRVRRARARIVQNIFRSESLDGVANR